MPQDQFLRGVGFVAASMFLFAVMDALARVLIQGYPLAQILWLRFGIFLAFAILLIGPRNLRAACRSAAPGLQLVRSLALVFEIGIFIFAFRFLPIGDVHAVAAAAPLIVLALCGTVLRERVPLAVWFAVAAGCVGVLVIVRPGFKEIHWYHLIPVIATISWGVYQTLVRLVGTRDSAHTTLIWTATIGFVCTSFVGPWTWKAPDAKGWGLLLAAGVLGAMAHYLLIKAYQACSAPRLQPFGYTLVVWAIAVGWLGLGEFPDEITLLGAAIIVAAGLFALSREMKRG
jgi:drug/metabolite transporter (DMT)-like permease